MNIVCVIGSILVACIPIVLGIFGGGYGRRRGWRCLLSFDAWIEKSPPKVVIPIGIGGFVIILLGTLFILASAYAHCVAYWSN